MQKKCNTAWGIFQAGAADRRRTWLALHRGMDEMVYANCNNQHDANVKPSRTTKRILNTLASAAGTSLWFRKDFQNTWEKSSGSHGDNDLSHFQSIQGGFQVWIFAKWVMLGLPLLRAMATQHGIERKKCESWYGKCWLAIIWTIFLGVLEARGRELDAKLPDTDDK